MPNNLLFFRWIRLLHETAFWMRFRRISTSGSGASLNSLICLTLDWSDSEEDDWELLPLLIMRESMLY